MTTALADVDEAVRSGTLLRGEVLARWHDVVGTGDLMRSLESHVGRLRDRLRAIVTGRPAAEAELRTAVQTGVDAVVVAAADRAAERAAAAWRNAPAGRPLLDAAPRLDAAAPDLAARTGEEVRAWQGEVLELVRAEGAGKRTTARLASLGVNGAGLTVMIAVFASTGGLTGAEIVVAGGTSALGQKVLEAVFGDQAVRTLAARARERLLERVAARARRTSPPASPPCSIRSRRRRPRSRRSTRPSATSNRRRERRPRRPARRARRCRRDRPRAARRRAEWTRPRPSSRGPARGSGSGSRRRSSRWPGRPARASRRCSTCSRART